VFCNKHQPPSFGVRPPGFPKKLKKKKKKKEKEIFKSHGGLI